MKTTKLIHGSEKVVETLGFWPGFHDAEVISFSASRALPLDANSPIANLVVRVRQYTEVGAGTADYEFAITKSILVNFTFGGISDISISEFNHQNVINSIKFTPIENGEIIVLIESIWGFGGKIKCSSVSVESVQELPVVVRA
ncbi:Imm50 family immunity protein [Pseudomonas flexibilis]|uniref:Imm50 family immunity protein n=1 Tax=Pseudomonas flexibilis TaxID=706570 RepID=UPI000970285C|nr:Imm50 family immunity protein [Pseudomonas flexibilis]